MISGQKSGLILKQAPNQQPLPSPWVGVQVSVGVCCCDTHTCLAGLFAGDGVGAR